MKMFDVKFIRRFEVRVRADDIKDAEQAAHGIIAQFPAATTTLLSVDQVKRKAAHASNVTEFSLYQKSRNAACTACDGTGLLEDDEVQECLTCSGTGRDDGEECPDCDGDGFTELVCKVCEGAGTVQRSEVEHADAH